METVDSLIQKQKQWKYWLQSFPYEVQEHLKVHF